MFIRGGFVNKKNHRSDRREKRKNRKQYLHPSEDVQAEAQNENGEEENDEFNLRNEKPILIKTLTPGSIEIYLLMF